MSFIKASHLLLLAFSCGIGAGEMIDDGNQLDFEHPLYGAKTYGILQIFDRHQPFILFRTDNGVHLLQENGTCYDESALPYSPSETELLYTEVSPQDNYIAWVNEEHFVCTKYLFHSDWNNAIAFDIKHECQTGAVSGVQFFSLSMSRHVIYAIGEGGNLFIITLRQPSCTFDVYHKRPEYQAGCVNAFHVTNFELTAKDIILIGVKETKEVHVLNIEGALRHKHQLESTDELTAIDSNSQGNVFLALKRGEGTLVQRFTIGLKYQSNETFFEAARGKVISISASNRLAAMLLLDGGNKTDYTLIFRPIPTNKSTETGDQEVWYHCANRRGLRGINLVDTREEPIVKDICKEQKSLCEKTINPKCVPNTVLHFKLSGTRVNGTIVDSELVRKSILTFALAVLGLLVMSCRSALQAVNAGQF